MTTESSSVSAPSVSTAVQVGSLALKNPILTASGTFGYGLEFAPYGDLKSLGGIIVKGLSLKPRLGNPMPRLAETPCGMLNAIGLQNIGVEAFLQDKLPALPHQDVPIIANLYACDADEFAALGGILARAEGIAAIEVNVSCPNVASGGILFGQDPTQAARVTEAVKKQAGNTPVWVKLTPNVSDIAAVARAVEKAGADALCCINTLPGMAVDLERRTPRLANVIGGLSGPAIKPVALRCVWEVARAVKIPVIGVGGITSARDVLEFILAGATAVQVGTANFMRPDAAFAMAAALPAAMQALRIASLDELRGTLKV
ncbi:dihydroorotate dehydrogenase [Megalodesulfovibrio gigas]|uniref:Dihydroorotate dehydrogenase n=1 Tax=Megalodesulfovibrio gigas (strain ATCC 19364 / DSM 1382 / NCIMB 9332 / VKM B-1759) TaxID=1121448 RepID=T2GCI4_MEGG1|nr:dihydroorotate dehydrogenase [Megalodesulfovibrio gigas]AGW14290.1 putative dihydroorotate dehydrogenase family protein [Megalodesulfovibrio gigas DSM 1382 = ATCC 19364]